MDEQSRLKSRYQKAAKSLTGVYWWIPTPGCENSVSWKVVAVYDRSDLIQTHADLWDQIIIDHMASIWKKPVKDLQAVEGMYCGLPRGRVAGDSSGAVILGGKDDPGPVDAIREQFNLSEDVEYMYEPHERMVRSQFEAVRGALSLKYDAKRVVETEADLVADPLGIVTFGAIEASIRRMKSR
jgi:hypothetical protein